MSLLEELKLAEAANMHSRPCQLCNVMDEMSEDERHAVARAVEIVGTTKLSDILGRNGYDVGRRAIIRHKEEGHGTSR